MGKLTYEQKIDEITKISEEKLRFPTMKRNDRGPKKGYVAKFSNGTDMGAWLGDQRSLLKEGKLKPDRKELFENFLSLEKKLEMKAFELKLEQTIQICKKCGYYPTIKAKTDTYKEFSDGSSIGEFIKNCREIVEKEDITEEQRNKIQKLLNLEKEFISQNLKVNLTEAMQIMRNELIIPPSKQKGAREENLRSLQSGVDVGTFLNHCDYRYKNNLFNDAEKKYWENFLKFKEKIKKRIFLDQMLQLVEETKKLKRMPVKDDHKNKKTHVRKFKNGFDMGYFIYKYSKKIESNDITKLEAHLFKKYFKLVKELEKEQVLERIKESMEIAEELGAYPESDTPYADQTKVRKLSDGTDAGRFIKRYILKLQRGEIPKEYISMYQELENMDIDKSNIWMLYFLKIREYYNQYKSLNIPIDYISEDGLSLGKFMQTEKENYSSENKTILQLIHEDKLSSIDEKWYLYDNKDIKINIKK